MHALAACTSMPRQVAADVSGLSLAATSARPQYVCGTGRLAMAQFHVLTPADDRLTALPVVRRISLSDLSESLRQGWEDFKVWPTHAVFLCIIYPIVGLVLGGIALGYAVLPLL